MQSHDPRRRALIHWTLLSELPRDRTRSLNSSRLNYKEAGVQRLSGTCRTIEILPEKNPIGRYSTKHVRILKELWKGIAENEFGAFSARNFLWGGAFMKRIKTLATALVAFALTPNISSAQDWSENDA